jgi:hypothetical protein
MFGIFKRKNEPKEISHMKPTGKWSMVNFFPGHNAPEYSCKEVVEFGGTEFVETYDGKFRKVQDVDVASTERPK